MIKTYARNSRRNVAPQLKGATATPQHALLCCTLHLCRHFTCCVCLPCCLSCLLSVAPAHAGAGYFASKPICDAKLLQLKEAVSAAAIATEAAKAIWVAALENESAKGTAVLAAAEADDKQAAEREWQQAMLATKQACMSQLCGLSVMCAASTMQRVSSRRQSMAFAHYHGQRRDIITVLVVVLRTHAGGGRCAAGQSSQGRSNQGPQRPPVHCCSGSGCHAALF